MNLYKFNKKKGGYVALDNPENSINKNIIPDIDEGGYLIQYSLVFIEQIYYIYL
jgi:hypothetical protein